MLIIQGLNDLEISKILKICVSTVKTHNRSIYKKFGIKSRVKLVVGYYEQLIEKNNQKNENSGKIIIKNWSVKSDNDPYDPPEFIEYVLHGKVYNHPRITDGKIVDTSRLLDIDYDNRIAKTKNTEYYLEEVNPLWLEFLKIEKNCTLEEFLKDKVEHMKIYCQLTNCPKG